MTNEFGSTGEETTNSSQEGTDFGQSGEAPTGDLNDGQGIDKQEYETLQKRFTDSQDHIARLERENAEARDKVVELEAGLSKATTLDDALARIANQGEGQQNNVDPTDVAQIVEQVLGQKETASKQETNWSTVQNELTKTYSDWKTADAKVQERARDLDISLQDASQMARTNPKAFLKLFVPDEHQAARSSGTGETGQRGVAPTGDALSERKAYYSNLRKTNPNEYWSVDTQAQLRRELHNHN